MVICGQRLPSLRRTGEGALIRASRKVLVIALAVGLCQGVNAQAAFAPWSNISAQKYAKIKLGNPRQFACLNELWTQESHWNPRALNKSSGAFGIAQFLPTTWGNYKFEYKPTNPLKQIDYGLHYISVRYGSACKAWAHEQKHGWY